MFYLFGCTIINYLVKHVHKLNIFTCNKLNIFRLLGLHINVEVGDIPITVP